MFKEQKIKKITIKADDFEKFLTRLGKGEFGGTMFNPKALRKAISGDEPGFFERQFKKLQQKRTEAKNDKKLISGLLSEKKNE